MNSHVGYVVCSLRVVIEVPSFTSPKPTIGPPVPVIPLLPNPLVPVVPAVPVVPVPPGAEPAGVFDDNPPMPGLFEPNDGSLFPADDDPKVAPVPPGEAIPAALPSPVLAMPPSGLPKKPFTVVLASPR